MKSYFIRKNSKELQERLSDIGFTICNCCNFENAVWLSICTHHSPPSVHGIGYWDELSPYNSIQGALDEYLKETKKYDCGEDEELFLSKAKELYNVYLQKQNE